MRRGRVGDNGHIGVWPLMAVPALLGREKRTPCARTEEARWGGQRKCRAGRGLGRGCPHPHSMAVEIEVG